MPECQLNKLCKRKPNRAIVLEKTMALLLVKGGNYVSLVSRKEYDAD